MGKIYRKVREGEAKRERERSKREMKLLFNQWWAVWRRDEVSTVIRYTRTRTACTHTETGDWVSSLTRCHKPGGDRRGRSALPELSGEAQRETQTERLREREGERASERRKRGFQQRNAQFVREKRRDCTCIFSRSTLRTHTGAASAGDLLNAHGTV